MHKLGGVSAIKKKMPKFAAWLVERGAEMLSPSNQWELIRFKASGATCIIYFNQKGVCTFIGQAGEAYQAYLSNASWRAEPATKRKQRQNLRLREIRKRDGNECFYCLGEVSDEDESEEHLVSITHGGPDHIANLVLAHRLCNQRAGHLSVAEKIRIHVDAKFNQWTLRKGKQNA